METRTKWMIVLGLSLAFTSLVILRMLGLARKSQVAEPTQMLKSQSEFICPTKWHCVASGNPESSQYIEPFRRKESFANFLSKIEKESIALEGIVKLRDGGYRRIEFRSKLFGFVDDLEILAYEENDRVEVRSSSRVGKSDLGANRNRVEQLRKILE